MFTDDFLPAVLEVSATRNTGKYVYKILFSCVVLLLVFIEVLFQSVRAEDLNLISNEQGWSIKLETTSLDYKEETSSELGYRFYGSTEDGFYISLHVEPLLAKDNPLLSCREQYIKGVVSLPEIVVKSSLKIIETDEQAVFYKAKYSYKNTDYIMPNVNYYFPLNGYCADLHLGVAHNYHELNEKSFSQLATELKNSFSIKLL